MACPSGAYAGYRRPSRSGRQSSPDSRAKRKPHRCISCGSDSSPHSPAFDSGDSTSAESLVEPALARRTLKRCLRVVHGAHLSATAVVTGHLLGDAAADVTGPSRRGRRHPDGLDDPSATCLNPWTLCTGPTGLGFLQRRPRWLNGRGIPD